MQETNNYEFTVSPPQKAFPKKLPSIISPMKEIKRRVNSPDFIVRQPRKMKPK